MRGRTLLASATLALLTLVWSAPAALAAPNEDDPKPPTSSSSSVSGSQSSTDQEDESDKPKPVQQPSDDPKPEPKPEPKPKPVEQPKPSTPPQQVAPAIAPVKAFLSVSPTTARPGDFVTADARCVGGTQKSLTASGVNFSGNRARIDDGTAQGSHTVTLVCANGPQEDRATANFTVERNGNGQQLRASLSVSPNSVRPGQAFDTGAACQGGNIESLTGDDIRFEGTRGRVADNARDGDHGITLVCSNPVNKDTARGNIRVDRNGSGPGIGDPQATLSVSPKRVKQGDWIYANGTCVESTQVDLRGDDVRFRGNRGLVDDNAREGEHRVTRVCKQGNKTVEATDTFRVEKGEGWDGHGPKDFWLSDRSGYQGDEIDLSVRCRDDRARVESDALDDVTLHRDGSRLTGTTHVEHDAKVGWHRVTVTCDGNRESRGFWVNRDRDERDFLDLDPGYGHRGDEIDVNVRCDDGSVGRLDSDVLDDIELDHDHDNRYSGTTHVQDDADRGEYEVKIRCGDDTLRDYFFVRGDDDNDGDDEPDGGEYVSVYPKGGVETGGGPVGDNSGNGPVALGLLGLTGAGLAGTGATLARRRSVRR